jgi:flagellar basal body-associated protein FliL
VSVDNTLDTDDNSDDNLSGGEIAGITIGVAVFVALCCAALYYFLFIHEGSMDKVAFNAQSDVEIAL